jgi:hypothetical protein
VRYLGDGVNELDWLRSLAIVDEEYVWMLTAGVPNAGGCGRTVSQPEGLLG